jgi:hypothetical protein
MNWIHLTLPLAISAVLASGCSLDVSNVEWEPRSAAAVAAPLTASAACEHRDPGRIAFFGDLHVHTGYSMDARTREMTLTPDDAYRYATGETILLPDPTGTPSVPARIDRPLDFAAVTDHAEWLAEVRLCTDPASPIFESDDCRMYRGEHTPWWGKVLMGDDSMLVRILGVSGLAGRSRAICGEPGRCRSALLDVWSDTQAAAERWYDRTSACSFTSFHAWEYSRSPQLTKIHRNVILRNEISPEMPISSIDAETESELWQRLNERCNDTGTGCEALTIPHNPNLSNGNVFALADTSLPLEEQRAAARLRAGLEPIAEVTQAKGDSECRNGFAGIVGGPDEFCDYEKMRMVSATEPEECAEGETGAGALRGKGCASPLDFARYAIVAGITEAERLGTNPFRVGFIGSTDTHNAAPGAVQEFDWIGTRGASTVTPAQRLQDGTTAQTELVRNPGGLAGVFAEENRRDALFDGMKRAETFATTGPRIRPRFFAGALPADWCEREDAVAVGYERGVPMGGDLQLSADGGPVFGVSALRDPGTPEHPGGLLQRAQIVKGWTGEDGRIHQQVIDVAGGDNDAGVDLATCQTTGAGHESLCGTWTDPEFDPDRPAVYYARVLENPSCRWHMWQCVALPESERPSGCSSNHVPTTVQERAYTSPIWYTPEP